MSFGINQIPAWIIEREYRRDPITLGACIIAIQDGTAAFSRETENALLFEWTNTINGCKYSGGKFWVPKSVLEK